MPIITDSELKTIIQPAPIYDPINKPFGIDIEPNRKHWAGAKLRHAYLFPESNLGKDSAGEKDGFVSGSDLVWTGGNLNVFGDASTDRINLGSIVAADFLSLSQNTTIICRVYFDSANVNNDFPRIFDKSNGSDGTNGYGMWIWISGGLNWKFVINNNEWNCSVNTPDVSGWYTLVGRFELDNDRCRLAVLDDKNLLLGTDEENPASPTHSSTTTDMAIANFNHSTDREWSGLIEYIYFFDGIFSDPEWMKLVEAPYQVWESQKLIQTPALEREMGGHFYIDPRAEAPELLIPWQKPAAPVTVNRDNWAGQHLRYGTIFPAGIAIDVVGSVPGEIDGSPQPVADYVQFEHVSEDVGDKLRTTYKPSDGWPNGITILIDFWPDDAIANNDYHYPLVMDVLELTWDFNPADRDRSIGFKVGGSFTDNYAKHNAVVGQWNHVACIYDNELISTYLNGIFQDSETNPSGVIDSPAVAMSFGQGGEYWSGRIRHVFVFDHPFNAAQIQMLHDDPYQILLAKI